MTAAFGALSTISLGAAVASATTSVARPAGVVATVGQVLVAAAKLGPLIQPDIAGWIPLGVISHGATADAADAGSMRGYAWFREATGSETANVTITWGTTPTAGQAFIYSATRAAGTSWSVAFQSLARSATTTAWSVAFGNSRDLVTAGDLLSIINAVPTDLCTASSAGTLTSTGLTTPGSATARIAHSADAGGSDSAVWFDSFQPTAGTSSVSATYASTLTGGTNLYGISMAIRLREVALPVRSSVEAITAPVIRFRADSLSLADGAAVTSWPALSSPYAATALSGGTSPTFLASGANGRPGVVFNGTSQFLALTSTASAALGFTANQAAVTCVAVIHRTGTNAAVRTLTQASVGTAAGTGRFNLSQPVSVGHRTGGRRLDADASITLGTGTDALDNSLLLLHAEVNYATAELRLWENGTLKLGLAGPGTGNTSATNSLAWNVGANSAGAEFWSGTVYEIMFFQGVLSDTERASVNSYVKERYAHEVNDYATLPGCVWINGVRHEPVIDGVPHRAWIWNGSAYAPAGA